MASAELADRKANYERAHADLIRMQALIAKKEISSLQFDRYVQAERSAQGQLDAAQQTLAAQRDTADIRDATVQTAASKVQQAKAQLSEAQANHQQVAIRTHDSAAAQAAVKMAQATLRQRSCSSPTRNHCSARRQNNPAHCRKGCLRLSRSDTAHDRSDTRYLGHRQLQENSVTQCQTPVTAQRSK